MGNRRVVKYQADIIDSLRSDWTISDDGKNEGPIDQWPAPFLGTDDGSNLVPRRELRRAGTRNGMRFDESCGPIPPQILPKERDQDFDDGGLWRSERFKRDNAFADLRHEEAIFSRTHLSDNTPRPATPDNAPGGGDAYRFLRRRDPGDDLTYAPRWRGGRQVISTSAVNAGAGYMYEFTGDPVHEKRQQRRGFSGVMQYSDASHPYESVGDAADIYSDIGTMHVETYNQIVNQFKVPMTASEAAQLQERFQQLQRVAKQPAWYPKGVADIHKVCMQILIRHYGGPSRVPPAQAQALNQNMIRIGTQVSAGQPKGVLGDIVSAVESVGKGIGSAVVTIGGSVVSIATAPARLVVDVAKGKNVLESFKDNIKSQIKAAKDIAPYAQAVLSVVPGVGSGVSAALGAGLALANGQNITDALAAGVRGALPGGPLAAAAFDTAANLAKGKSIDQALLAAARERLPGGPIAKAAFDVGLAVAQGQNVQRSVVASGSMLLPGGETVQSAARKIASGQNVANVLKDAVVERGTMYVKELSQKTLSPMAQAPMSRIGPVIGSIPKASLSIVPQNVKMVANALLNNPQLRSLPIAEVARRLNVPDRDAREAYASVMQAAQRAAVGVKSTLAPAPKIAERMSMKTTFDQNLARFGSRVAPIAFSPNVRPGVRPIMLPRIPSMMNATGLQDAGAFGTIKLGSTGPDVMAWQKIINVKPDGKFGPQTDASTRAYQRSKGLVPDGVVGPKTWEAATGFGTSVTVNPTAVNPASSTHVSTLPEVTISAAPPPPLTTGQQTAINDAPTLRLGSTGPVVTTWQGILRRDSGISGFTIVPDGVFGPITDTCTRKWQGASGLVADGIVGPKTWARAIGSLTTPPLPAEIAPGVPMKTPVPVGLPPGLPPVPTEPVRTVPPVTQQRPPPTQQPPSVPKTSPVVPIALLAVGAKVLGFI